MTTKERLHELVDHLDEADAHRLLDATLALTATRPQPAGSDLPAFIASCAPETSNTATRAEVIPRDELG